MGHVGMDVHKKHCQIYLVTAEGEVVEARIETTRDSLQAFYEGRAKSKVLIEASTESEWVARCLEGMGHEVIVADPNYSPMYGNRKRRKKKNDREDTRLLWEANVHGIYRTAHRVSDEQRRIRTQLRVRRALIQSRTKWISVVRSATRAEGLRIVTGKSGTFVERVEAVGLPEDLKEILAPLLRELESLEVKIAACDAKISEGARGDETVARLMTVPGIGVVTAVAFRAQLDRVDRFESAHQVEGYLGVVPSSYDSGEKQRRGGITKAGPSEMRWLLVQCAHVVMRSRSEKAAGLCRWSEGIVKRGGKKVAAVALARKLAGILYAIWRNGTRFDPHHTPVPPRRALPASLQPSLPASG